MDGHPFRARQVAAVCVAERTRGGKPLITPSVLPMIDSSATGCESAHGPSSVGFITAETGAIAAIFRLRRHPST